MPLVLENMETGETRIIKPSSDGKYPSWQKPWKYKQLIKDELVSIERQKKAAEKKARLAVAATKVGLPVPAFLKFVRQVGRLNCPYCQLGTQVLKKLDELGEEAALDLLARILLAKKQKDAQTLAELVEEFNGRRSA